MVFHVNVLEGEFDAVILDPLYWKRGLFWTAQNLVQEEVKSPGLGSSGDQGLCDVIRTWGLNPISKNRPKPCIKPL